MNVNCVLQQMRASEEVLWIDGEDGQDGVNGQGVGIDRWSEWLRSRYG
jgi:hypothetical protein